MSPVDKGNGGGGKARSRSGGQGGKRERKRQPLIIALLQHSDLEKAAAAIGMSTSTAYRIRKTQEFQAEYLKARRDAVSQAIARLQQNSVAAVTTILKIMVDAANPPSSRLRAADRVLQNALHALEIEDLEVRLQRLERQVNKQEGESGEGGLPSDRHNTGNSHEIRL